MTSTENVFALPLTAAQRDTLIAEAYEIHEEIKGYAPWMQRLLAMSDAELLEFHSYVLGL